MARLPREQVDTLRMALYGQDHSRRIVEQVAALHRVVFHTYTPGDDGRIQRSAEQIVMAELVSRHQGRIEGLYFDLRALEDSGRAWDAAIAELAARVHSYFTTPLGILIRKDMFGEDAVFISPDAVHWREAATGRPAGGSTA